MTSADRWLDEEQQRTWQELLTVVIALPALLDRQLQGDAGISNFEYSVMARLSMTPSHSMRLGELATLSNSTQPRLSKLMSRFEHQGWVTRHPDPDDGRYTFATLTEAGFEKVVDSAPSHVAMVEQLVFAPLTRSQQRQLGATLARVAAELRRRLD